MIWFRRLHKWIGLAIGVQIVLWMVSGFMMGWLNHEQVQGQHYRAVTTDAPFSTEVGALLEPTAIFQRLPSGASVGNARLTQFLDRPTYRLTIAGVPQLLDAYSGQRVVVTKDTAATLATRDYAGPGSITAVTSISAPSMEVRRHHGPVWRVDFDDEDDTSLYVSANDGAILERRNASWRLFDVFWMLHIMDYQGREDFNNVLAILASLIAAWFSLTGVVLFFESFRREDFLAVFPESWWRKPARVAVCAPHGEVVARIDSFNDGRLYDELAKEQILLPSNCGGGGTCGLCVVTLDPSWPESAADRRLIPTHQRQQGVRLACQAKIADNMVVGISDEVLSAETHRAEVIDCRFVTPFIREISLRIDDKDFGYVAGSYVHVIIPPHEIDYATLETSPAVRGVINATLPKLSISESEIRRAYSLATPGQDSPGTVVLNVRFLPPPPEASATPAGVGSTYMWSLKRGDRLDVVGPLGDFRAQESDHTMVFIGGGAGMAPLRAIIRDELLYKGSGRQIHFWYGARGRSDLLYEEEFEALQAQHPHLHWQPVLSDPLPADDWEGPNGFVHIAVEKELRSGSHDLRSTEFYVCGPPPMLAATRQMLADLGVSGERVFFDDFGI